MKPKLSPEEKAEKIARDQLKYAHNRVMGQWSFGKIKIFRDLLEQYGYDKEMIKRYHESELSKPVMLHDVHDFLSDRKIELDTYFWLKKNPPQNKWDESHEIVEQATKEIIDEGKKVPERISTVEVESDIYSDKEYKVPDIKRNNSFLFWFQKKAIREVLCKLFGVEHWAAIMADITTLSRLPITRKAVMLIAGTGTGKTFIAGYLLAALVESKYTEGKTYTPWPIIYVTKASVVEQTKRVLEQFFSLTEEDVLVINIDQLRAKFGKLFVKEQIVVEDGVDRCMWVWRNNIHPLIIVWDECQALKNRTSQQSQIAQSFNELESPHIMQIFMSATPLIRVIESQCFVVATRVPYTFGIQRDAPMTNGHFNDFARNIASNYGQTDTEPTENSPAAVNRLMNYMDDYVVRVKGVKPQFHAKNRVEIIDFESDEGRKYYDDAWERFLEEKAKIEGDESLSGSQSRFQILAQLTVFLKAAESNPDRINIMTKRMVYSVKEGFAAVAAVRNKLTICKLVQKLVYEYNVPRNQISLIWGGAPVATKKQKLKLKITSNEALQAAFAESGITLEDLELDDVDEKEIQEYPPSLRLGNQNPKTRQEEIDRFQRGESLYCFYTFRAGGVGLSLHHTDEFTKQKVRHKESGYAFEEDIPSIPTRPRRNFVSPTWSAIELVQGIGRCPRLTSLSDTEQTMMFFRGTVEERQARVVSLKLHCLTKVVRNKESWEDLIINRQHIAEDELEKQMSKEPDAITKENGDDETEGTWNEEDDDAHGDEWKG